MSETGTAAYSSNATFNGVWSATPLTIVICSAIAGYNVLEGLILILSTFRQYKGLYFWSLIIATCGILIYMIALILWYFALVIKIAALAILYPGWILMVTGQSVVLYSRLGIIMGSERENTTKAVKWMIIVDAIVFHSLTIVISVGSFYAPNPPVWATAYYYVERLQITAFGVQELVISGVYIWRTLEILRSSVRAQQRRIIIELLIINLILVIIDVATVTLEYCNLFFFEVAFKMFSYSIKLKLEFAILSKLMLLSGADESTRQSRGDSLAYVPENQTLDISYTTSATMPLQDVSNFVEKAKVETSENSQNSRRTIIERHRTHEIDYGAEDASDRKDSDVSYAGIMRALSRA